VPRPFSGHARLYAGHPRLVALGQDVDGRDKPGHDGKKLIYSSSLRLIQINMPLPGWGMMGSIRVTKETNRDHPATFIQTH
jgi:hypothetical protein